MFGKIFILILFIIVGSVIVSATFCVIFDMRNMRRKYVSLFSTEGTTVDSPLRPQKTLYYESIYGITDTGKVRLLRHTMEYPTKEAAKKERELVMEVLTKKNLKQ